MNPNFFREDPSEIGVKWKTLKENTKSSIFTALSSMDFTRKRGKIIKENNNFIGKPRRTNKVPTNKICCVPACKTKIIGRRLAATAFERARLMLVSFLF